MSCGAETVANGLLTSLVAGKDFTLPNVDFTLGNWSLPDELQTAIFSAITPVALDTLTTRTIDGDGVFDAIMQSIKVHLKDEYDNGRITGAEYTKTYQALVQAALGNAVQFALGKDAAYWQAVAGQIAAITAKVALETAKANYMAMKAQALTYEASYALTKLKLSTEEAQFCTATFNLDNLLPEQLNALRAQTLDTRTDGVPVAGSIGKQKALYTQQIDSYKRSSELNAAKVFTDAWAVNMSISEPATIPTGFADANIDAVLTSLKTNNNL